MASPPPRTLVLGLGNDILTDDAIGLLVAREVARRVAGRPDVEVTEASTGGFGLLDLVGGFDRLVVVDAICTRGGRPGQLHRLGLDDLPATSPDRLRGAHEVDLRTALELGRRVAGARMPVEVAIVAVEIQEDRVFSERPTPEVEAALGPAVEAVMAFVGSPAEGPPPTATRGPSATAARSP